MLKREEKALRVLMAKWNVAEAMSYSSGLDFEDGIDRGRENCADELEWELAKLKEKTLKAKK